VPLRPAEAHAGFTPRYEVWEGGLRPRSGQGERRSPFPIDDLLDGEPAQQSDRDQPRVLGRRGDQSAGLGVREFARRRLGRRQLSEVGAAESERGGNLASGLGSESSLDSPLEGAGFEPSVPGREKGDSGLVKAKRGRVTETTRGGPKTVSS
jgi:hypothetical protein